MAAKTGFEQTQKMEQTQRQVALPSTILVGQMLEKSYEEAMQYVNDEWVELEVVMNPDGTITIKGVVEGPIAIFAK